MQIKKLDRVLYIKDHATNNGVNKIVEKINEIIDFINRNEKSMEELLNCESEDDV